MMKKFLLYFLVFSSLWVSIITFAWWNAPEVNCYWLPWCTDSDIEAPWTPWNNFTWIPFLSNLIWEVIKYVSVISVIALMIAWIMYMVSAWEEEKAKKAKSWIIWSLVWVFLSISAWWIINILNLFKLWW